MKAAADGLFSVNKAADEFGVPRLRLKDRLSGKIVHGTRSGQTPYLSWVEKDKPVKFLLTSIDISLPKTRSLALCQKAVMKKQGTGKGFNSEGWWHWFLERHLKLSLFKGDALALSRAAAITMVIVWNSTTFCWKQLWKSTVFWTAPVKYTAWMRVGCPWTTSLLRLLHAKGQRKFCVAHWETRLFVSVPVSLFVLWSYLIDNVSILSGVREKYLTHFMECQTMGGQTKNPFSTGWRNSLSITFLPPHLPMLLVDGHSSHYEPETIRTAAEAGIVMFFLPPHSTHMAQPLDVSFFQPWRCTGQKPAISLCRTTRIVTRYQFSPLFAEAWYKAIHPGSLVAGFVKAGVCLFNLEAISSSWCRWRQSQWWIFGWRSPQWKARWWSFSHRRLSFHGGNDRSEEDAFILEESHSHPSRLSSFSITNELWDKNRGKYKGRQPPGVEPRTPLAWATSTLPLSHDSRTTTNPHNPLYVLHRWYSMPQSHTWQPLSIVPSNPIRGQPQNSLHQERTQAE